MIHMMGLIPNTINESESASFIADQVASLRDAPGLIDITVSEGSIMSPGGPPPFAKIFQARWKSLGDMMTWTQAQGTGDEGVKFMLQNGAALIFYEVRAA